MKKRIEYTFFLFYRYMLIFLIMLTVLSISCYQDVVELDLSEFDSRIVIEGIITDQPGPHRIRITRTISYESSGDFPSVSGAEVVISDDSDYTETLRAFRAGTYQTDEFQGVPGRTYTLSVFVEGEEYTASCKMPEAVELDSITYNIYGGIAYLRCVFYDREGIDDFFRLKIYRNGDLVETYLYQGRFRDGQKIILDDFITPFLLDDQVRIEMHTIDRIIYEYLAMLGEDNGESFVELPDILPLTAYNPNTNLSNGALGYFSAQTKRTYTFIVE